MPAAVRLGTPTVAAMIYAAVLGRPIPMMMQANMTSRSMSTRCPPESLNTMLVNLMPMPVIDTIPITIPAQAQATVTDTVVLEAFTKALNTSLKGRRLFVSHSLTKPMTSSTAMLNSAAKLAERPKPSSATINTMMGKA